MEARAGSFVARLMYPNSQKDVLLIVGSLPERDDVTVSWDEGWYLVLILL